MRDQTTAVVDIDAIAVDQARNPRRTIDPARLAELEASIRQQGITTALTVQPAEDGGGYRLVAGHRRLLAAKAAGLSQVPVLIRAADSSALAAAITENVIRADLNPIEEGDALALLAEVEDLATHARIAERIGRSTGWVSQRLRLRALPEGCRTQIAAGKVPVEAERDLRRVAKVSPQIAECVCELVGRGDLDGSDLVDSFGDALDATAHAEFDPQPTMVPVGYGVALDALVPDADRRDALERRYRANAPSYVADQPTVRLRLDESHIDAARAAGCLIEHTDDSSEWHHVRYYVTDSELAADIAERIIETHERDAHQTADANPDRRSDAAATDVKEERRRARQEAAEAAIAARRRNLTLGEKLIARRGGKARRAHALARARAVAEILLADHDRLAAAGLRLVLPQLQQEEGRTLKSGEQRVKVTYADPDAAHDYLRARIAEAKSADAILELLADTLIAALVADEKALPQSRRVPGWVPAQDAVLKHLADEIKAVKPRREKTSR